MRHHVKIALVMILLAAAGLPAAAIQEVYVRVNPAWANLDLGPSTGSLSIPSYSFNSGGGGASASPGILGLSSHAGPTGTSGGAFGIAMASTTGDVTFSCTGLCGSSVAVALNLVLSGTQFAQGMNHENPLATGSGSTTVELQITLNGNASSGTTTKSAYGTQLPPFTPGFPATPTVSQTGLLNGWSSTNNTVTSATVVVPLNVPVPVSFLLKTMSTNNAWGTASSNFSNTLMFPLNAPVFALPAGYTATSTDFGIVDNHFVPEPATTALIGLGLVAVAWRRRSQS